MIFQIKNNISVIFYPYDSYLIPKLPSDFFSCSVTKPFGPNNQLHRQLYPDNHKCR